MIKLVIISTFETPQPWTTNDRNNT